MGACGRGRGRRGVRGRGATRSGRNASVHNMLHERSEGLACWVFIYHLCTSVGCMDADTSHSSQYLETMVSAVSCMRHGQVRSVDDGTSCAATGVSSYRPVRLCELSKAHCQAVWTHTWDRNSSREHLS
eukprot:3777159-Prymnesium_polylepis.1